MYIIDVLPFGIMVLGIYIAIDLVRNKTRNLIKRIVFYSFIFYLINVFRVTTGGISVPPSPYSFVDFQLIPFKFLIDWINEFSTRGFSWFFWNSVRLSMLNVLLLLPLGIYLPILYNVKNIKKVTIYVALASLIIEIYQAIFSYFGLVFIVRTSNVDDIILNTLGGVSGYILYKILLSKWIHRCI